MSSYNTGAYSLDLYAGEPASASGPSTVTLAATGVSDESGSAARGVMHSLTATGGDLDGGEAILATEWPAPSPTTDLHMRWRRSYSYTAPGVDVTTGVMGKQTRTLLTAEVWGYYQIIVGGVDVTVHRGKRTRLGQMTRAMPGGPLTLKLIFPAARPYEQPGSSALPWLKDGAAVTVRHRLADHSLDPHWAWEGNIHKPIPVINGDDWHWEADAKGFAHCLENKAHTPPFTFFTDAAQDIGHRLVQILNYTGRLFRRVPAVTIGILTGDRGSLSQSKMQAVLNLLAAAWTTDGRQYSLIADPGPGRKMTIGLPSRTVAYHLALGADGLDLSGVTPGGGLAGEGDEAPNVVFGEYITPDGYRSQNIHYAHSRDSTPPPYPGPPTFTPGSSTTGFAPFAQWLRDHGYAIYSGDTYDARDEDEVKQAQGWMKVTVDGIVGAQTWGTAFDTGTNATDLGSAQYFPLAADTRTQPRKWTPDGQDLGPNSDYDPTFPVREIYINFGSGVTRREVLRAARQIVARNTSGYNYAGQIRITCDVEECSRLDILEGKVLAIRYLAGSGNTGVPFFISQVSLEDPESDDSPVLLDVDTKFRDAPTMTQLIENRRDAKNDPAHQRRLQETGKLTQSTQPVFDRDNAAGLIGKHTIQGGYWRIVRFPAGSYGTFVEMIATTSPHAEFVLGLFVKPVTANFMAENVGNPLDPLSERPFDVNRTDLRDAGFIQGWGSGVQPGGYSEAFTGAKSAGDPLTGQIEDNASTDWASFAAPWLYLAEYSSSTTDITVTFRNAPEQV